MFYRISLRTFLLTLSLCLLCTLTQAAEIQIVETLATFPLKASKQFKIISGSGVTVQSTLGATQANKTDLLELSFEISDTTAKNARWFTLELLTPLDSQKISEADGIGIELAATSNGAWWLNTILKTTESAAYTHVLIPQQVQENFQQRLIAFDLFKSREGKTLPIQKVQRFQISGSVYAGKSLLIKRIFLYRLPQTTLKQGVRFQTNRPENNIFEPGKTVTMKFDCPQGFPAEAQFLQCQVRDFFDKVVFEHTFKIQQNAMTLTVDFDPGQSGFYGVQTWWLDGEKKRLEKLSCIRTTGSLPQGHGTFAIVPRTIKQSQRRMQRVGNQAFLGFHGTHGNLQDLIGVSWRLDSSRWPWLEPKQPDRSQGLAAWAQKIIAQKPPRPTWINTLVNLQINLQHPAWAKTNTPNVVPGFKDWDMYFDFFRDYVQVSKHLSPHMGQRIYDIAWEINLNKPGSGTHKPTYYPKDVIEIYRRARQVIDTTDPNAILMGPCSSALRDYSWNLSLFKLGLLQYLDAYNAHGYHAPPPEQAQIPAYFKKLRQDIRQYNHGKQMDIYITELGYRSMDGPVDRQKDQARWHVRVAGILKGEGIRAYLPFYSYDYRHPSNGSWGICYNLDPKQKFGPAQVCPKAAVPALAVFADQTEGLMPVTRLTQLSPDLWGYIYASPKGDDTLAMLWSVQRGHRFTLPVGDKKQVTVTNMMGASRTLPVQNGIIALDISPSPIYVRGLSSQIYPSTQTIDDNLIATLYPGDKQIITLPKSMRDATILASYGTLQVRRNEASQWSVKVAPKSPAGLVPIRYQLPHSPSQVKWIAIRQPLELMANKIIVKDSQIIERIKLYNHAQQAMDVQLRLTLDHQLQSQQALHLPGQSQKQLDIPLALASQSSPTRTWQTVLKLTSASLEPMQARQSFNLLAAHQIGPSTQGKFNNQALWSGKGASGKTDQAQVQFTWNANALILDIQVHDDVFDQRRSNGVIWQQDSVQLSFDTDPDQQAVYEPLAGIFTKKLSRLAFALTPQGPLAWRHNSYNQEQLPLGNVTKEFQMTLENNTTKKITNYHLVIPWQQIGLQKVQAGKSIGISILINDSDGPQTKRAMYELFSGLTTRLPQNNGRLLLQ